MHLKTQSFLIALENMLKFTTSQILLIENFQHHDFYNAIKNMYGELNLYTKTLHEARMIVISKVPLNYKPLLSQVPGAEHLVS